MDSMNVDKGINCKNEDKEKEHFTPVSVMGPPFVDDDERLDEDSQENETTLAYVQSKCLVNLLPIYELFVEGYIVIEMN